MKLKITINIILLTLFCGVSVFSQEKSKDKIYFDKFRLKNISLDCACKGGKERKKLKRLTGEIWNILSEKGAISFSKDFNEISITDTRQKLNKVEKLIEKLESSITPLEKSDISKYSKISLLYCPDYLPSRMVQHFQFDDETSKWHSLLESKKPLTTTIMYYPFKTYISIEGKAKDTEKLEEFLESIDKPKEIKMTSINTITEQIFISNIKLGYCGENKNTNVIVPNKATSYILNNLRYFLPSSESFSVDLNSNSLVITDTPIKIGKLRSYIAIFDTPTSFYSKQKGCNFGKEFDKKPICN